MIYLQFVLALVPQKIIIGLISVGVMKKNFTIKGLALLFLLFGLVLSCSKDDDFSILGTWNIDKLVHDEGVESNPGIITFFRNGEGHTIEEDTGNVNLFNWSLDNDIITLVISYYDGETRQEKYKIMEKSQNRMIWEFIKDEENENTGSAILYLSRL